MKISSQMDIGLDDSAAAERDVGGSSDCGAAGDFVARVLGKWMSSGSVEGDGSLRFIQQE
jgi:hypothetical protein